MLSHSGFMLAINRSRQALVARLAILEWKQFVKPVRDKVLRFPNPREACKAWLSQPREAWLIHYRVARLLSSDKA